jgi:hypothetical protein
MLGVASQLMVPRIVLRRVGLVWFSLVIYRDGINFADKRRSLGRYSSLADSGHGVYYLV